MKACPVCGARAFDDAEVCYGCLHQFGSEDVRVPTPVTAPVEEATVRCEVPTACKLSTESVATPTTATIPVIDTTPSVRTIPFDQAGWVVRFELPGGMPLEGAGQSFEDTKLVKPSSEQRRGDLVVRIEPASADPARRVRGSRGSHAREAPMGRIVSVSPAARA